MKYYTDVASEITPEKDKRITKNLDFGCVQTLININNERKQKLYDKPRGEYFCLECQNLFTLAPIVCEYMQNILADFLKEKVQELAKNNSCKVLVVCLGNQNFCSDSLGSKVFEKLIICNQRFCNNTMYACKPEVYGKTNIKTQDFVQAIVKKVQPNLCVIVDSLCSKSITRLGSCVQVCDSGMVAGGGVNPDSKMILDRKVLGVPTLCIGVPLVVRVENIINEFLEALSDSDIDEQENMYIKYKKLIVQPKNIEDLVRINADIIAGALNFAILGLDSEEQKQIKK